MHLSVANYFFNYNVILLTFYIYVFVLLTAAKVMYVYFTFQYADGIFVIFTC